MFQRGSSRRPFDHHKRSCTLLYHRTQKWLSRKYGLSLLNAVLLCSLLFSWIWILKITTSSSPSTLSTLSTLQQSDDKHMKHHTPHHMRDLVEKYNEMKWKDAHNTPHQVEQFNASKHYNHKSGDPVFDIWSAEDLQNDEICPDQFPKEVPKYKDMLYVCSHLEWFKFGGNCNKDNCSDCIPPNSKVPGQEWTNTDTAPWLEQYEKTLKERRQNLSTMLQENKFFNKNDGPIIVITINDGYSFLFLNWVCSLDHNQLTSIKRRTIIIPTQRKTIPLIEKAGFKMIFYPDWLGAVIGRIEPEMPKTFALGAHRWVVSLQIAAISDLVALGYDVITQDSDIVYVRNPLLYLMQPRFKEVDIQMMPDGRNDRRGPGNSGYYIVRSNCKTKVLMKTMIKMIGAVLVARSDQILWNTLINEKMFRMIHFKTLSSDYFIGGNQINIKYGTKRSDLPKDTLLIHACWTTDQFDKIEKFYNVEHYYFTNTTCPQLYDYALTPDLKDKKWHIRAKTQEQEAKLMKLGLVRDTSNGHYTTPADNK